MSVGEQGIPEGTKLFDLYDFFSMLIPGSALIIGILPFFPQDTPITTVSTLAIVLVIGYVAGRGVHSLGELIDSKYNRGTHRDLFVEELRSPTLVEVEVADEFYHRARDVFSRLHLPHDNRVATDEKLETLYLFVRGCIHMQNQGRSRTFQAVASFYRSIDIVTKILIGVYILYGATKSAHWITNLVGFTSHLGSLGIQPTFIILGAYLFFPISERVFRDAREDYREYFIQYLLVDFLLTSQQCETE